MNVAAVRYALAAATCLGAAAPASTGSAAPVARPTYPSCPPPFVRRTKTHDEYVSDACGGFDEDGNVVDGWEVATYEDGSRREEHLARGKGNGPIRVWFGDGDFWIGNQVDGELDGRREYFYKGGGLWQEAELRAGHVDGVGRAWFRSGLLNESFRAQQGRIVDSLEWDEHGQLVEKKGNVASLLGRQTLEQYYRDNRRPLFPNSKPPPPPSGPLGSRTNPVRCDGVPGELAYLGRLKCSNGGATEFSRQGSVGFGPYGGIVDEYVTVCGLGFRSVFLDMYHPKYVERRAAEGFSLKY
jgi:hypothetical protein